MVIGYIQKAFAGSLRKRSAHSLLWMAPTKQESGYVTSSKPSLEQAFAVQATGVNSANEPVSWEDQAL